MDSSDSEDLQEITANHALDIERPSEDVGHRNPRSSSSRVHPYTTLPSTTRRPQRVDTACRCPSGENICSYFCCTFIILFISLWFLLPLLSFIYAANDPAFQVDSISVTSSNYPNNSIITYTWDCNITIKNNKNNLKIQFERMEVYLFNKDKFVSLASVEPFTLKAKKEKTMQARLKAVTLEHPFVKEEFSSSNQDKYDWEVNFNTKLAVWATYAPGSTWEWDLRMDVFCWDLKVGFMVATGIWKKSWVEPRPCFIYEY